VKRGKRLWFTPTPPEDTWDDIACLLKARPARLQRRETSSFGQKKANYGQISKPHGFDNCL
jgi:hypothetical protein